MQKRFIRHTNIFALALLLCLGGTSHAEVYSWVDDSGNTVFSDQKPSKGQNKPVANKPSSTVNYYQPQRPVMPVLEVVKEPSDAAFSVETTDKNDKKQWDEKECQKVYGLDCDAVYNWHQQAVEACGRDKRCKDEGFLSRKYQPLTLEEKHKRTLRSSARNNRDDREIRQFLMRKYTPYCKQQAKQYCDYQRQGGGCFDKMENACQDPRSLSQLLTQYNLTVQEKKLIIDKAKSLIALQQQKEINETISSIIDLIKLQAMLL